MSEEPSDPNFGALNNFLDGLEEKMSTSFGRITSHESKREVKQEIAAELGVEDEYTPQIRSSVKDSDATRRARWEVRRRYRELRNEGKIVEAGEVAEQTKRFREWNERISAHLRGEECFYSEDLPHADWVQGEPSGDPSEGV